MNAAPEEYRVNLRIAFAAGAALALAAMGGAQTSNLVSLSSHVTYPVGTSADVWSEGDLVFVARRGEGIAIFNAANPAAPSPVWSGRPELFVQDVKVRGTQMACSNESGNGKCLYLFDISNPAAPVETGNFGNITLPTANNVAFFGNFLFCTCVTTNQVGIVDISNPATPVFAGSITSQSPVSLIHDIAIVGTRLYVSWLIGGFEIHDLSANPAAPALVGWKQVPASFVHNTWPLANPAYVATTDEVSGGYLTIWDVSNPSDIQPRGQWRASSLAVMHNVMIRDNLAFVTNYTEGLRIVDVSNVNAPVEVGYYDTFTGVNALTFGAWGVHAGDRDRVYVADFSSGLWVFDFRPMTATLLADAAAYTWGQTIGLTLGGTNLSPLSLPALLDLSFSIAQLGPGSASLWSVPFIMPGSLSGQIPYPIPLPAPGPPGPFTVTFTLSLASPANQVLYAGASTTVTIN